MFGICFAYCGYACFWLSASLGLVTVIRCHRAVTSHAHHHLFSFHPSSASSAYKPRPLCFVHISTKLPLSFSVRVLFSLFLSFMSSFLYRVCSTRLLCVSQPRPACFVAVGWLCSGCPEGPPHGVLILFELILTCHISVQTVPPY